MNEAASRPWILMPNRVERFYIGGRELDRWQGLEEGKGYGDSTFSEELIVNTHPYIGPGKPRCDGLSFVEGMDETLRALIEKDPEGFLGKDQSRAYGSECSVLCRVGDSTGRLILQYHPTRSFAQSHLHCAFGKTEAWYILSARGQEERYCYAGFRPGVTRARFEKLVERDDVEGMLACIHKIPIHKGDTVLIPAGTIHAMCPGITFIEAHEPCDYTMRFERDNYGRRMEDYDLHYGIGFQALFDGLSFETYTEDEILSLVRFAPEDKGTGDGWVLKNLLSFSSCPEFAMEKLEIKEAGSYILPKDGSYAELIALKGVIYINAHPLKQGQAAFVPANAGELKLTGDNAEVMIIRPGSVM